MEIKVICSQILSIEAVFTRQEKHQWDIMLMPFANYGKAPLEKLGDDWVQLSTCECIVGGLNIAFDFM
jgi:hypothetical protein